MKRCIFLIPVFVVLLAGCKQKTKIPSGILPAEKMEAVLWDMLRADQFLASYVLPVDTALSKKTEHIRMYLQVLDKHQVERKVFKKSFTYYKANPGLLKVIMDSLSRQPQASPPEPITPISPITDEVAPLEPVPVTTTDTAKIPLRKIKPKMKMRK